VQSWSAERKRGCGLDHMGHGFMSSEQATFLLAGMVWGRHSFGVGARLTGPPKPNDGLRAAIQGPLVPRTAVAERFKVPEQEQALI
jgi:hypothetical protein